MSCVEGWWNYNDQTPEYLDEIWIYYDDAEDCSLEDVVLDNCGGSRGILAYRDSGAGGNVIPCTNNPFYQADILGFFQIRADINVLEMDSDFFNVEVFAVDEPYISNGGSPVMVGVGSVPDNFNVCQEIVIHINTAAAVEALKASPYIFFRVGSGGAPILSPPDPQMLPAAARGVFDNISVCSLIELKTTSRNCDEICLEVNDATCPIVCNQGSAQPGNEQGCQINIAWYAEGEPIAEEECNFTFQIPVECCFLPPAPGQYYAQVELVHLVGGQEVSFYEFFYVDFDPCNNVTIQGEEVWTQGNTDDYQTYGLITVPDGAKLTVAADVQLHFCESGRLIVEPGGKVELYGTLTAGCDAGWLGVEVQGNGSASQFPVSGAYSQGRLICHPGSVIEHAAIGVQLFGPTRADAGGHLQAVGATFRNNSRAIEFAAYHNYFVTPAKQRPYFAKIRDCDFMWNDDYQIGLPTRQHIKMDGVFGVGVYGCTFSNSRTLFPTYSPKEYGVGISATDTYFTVGSSSTPSTEPCPMPCAVINSTFTGLGKGIEVARVMRNLPFAVYSSRFEEVFYGIMVSGVHGADIMHNAFNFGQTHPISGDRDQVGIYFAAPQQFGSIQENTFERTVGNAGRAYGIVCNGTGPFANVIRKNSFDGMFIANQAFGPNAAGDNFDDPGLRYLCNDNNNPDGRDFNVPEVEGNGMDRIQVSQGDFPGSDVSFSAANTFSADALEGDGHFGNYGAFEVEYYYDPNAQEEAPDEDKIVNIARKDARENTCGENLCDGLPCLGVGLLSEIKGNFRAHSDSLAAALYMNDTIGVVYHNEVQLDALRNVLRRYELDTAAAGSDSLLVWYKKGPRVPGNFLALGLLASADSTTYVLNSLNAISYDTTLSVNDMDDARRMRFIYSALSGKSIDQFDADEADTLLLYARVGGAAMGVSHGLLIMSDTFVAPMYYVPGELAPRTNVQKGQDLALNIRPVVFPNPTTGTIFILPPDNNGVLIDRVDVIDGFGRLILARVLEVGAVWPVEIQLPNMPTGIYVVRCFCAGKVVASVVFSRI